MLYLLFFIGLSTYLHIFSSSYLFFRNWIVAVVFYGLGVFRMEIHRNVLAWMGLDWSERGKTVLDHRALNFAALNCYRLCLTSPDCITLHRFG